MVVAVKENNLLVYHTEVLPEQQGKGLAGKLFNAMVDYVREHRLQVVPYCLYVQGQFKKHPERFADIWKESGGEAREG